ncbi:uncharacterized protein LOC119574850 [Penaeus monodon]|uniref:uncharacterized protein LOC119574850 n=1 Tax=Penaeus monodon TaxID=6687 RepID=UPI0018A71D1B|nr:uncharacterized protein LOC119574850 [Penaeus monodon]
MDSNGDLPTETPFTISGSNRSDHWQRGGNAVRPAQVKHAFEQPGFMRVQSNICPACKTGTLEPDCTTLTTLACCLLGPCSAPCFMENRCPVCGYLDGWACC